MGKSKKERRLFDESPLGQKIANAMARSKANGGGPHVSIKQRIDRKEKRIIIAAGMEDYLYDPRN